MIDKLRALAIFSCVVEAGSFRNAASQLMLSPSVVSNQVSLLEKELGVTLLYRSTRQISPTDKGKKLHIAAQAMIAEAEIGLDALLEDKREARGTLKITLPAFFTKGPVADRVAHFALNNPNVSLRINYSDQRPNLIKDGLDVAFIVGHLDDSTLMCRKLATLKRGLVVSPSLLESRGVPESPAALTSWPWVDMMQRQNRLEFTNEQSKETQAVSVQARVHVDNLGASVAFASSGLGIALVPQILVKSEIADGRLVQILPDWHASPENVYAIYPANTLKDSLTSRLVDTVVLMRKQGKTIAEL